MTYNKDLKILIVEENVPSSDIVTAINNNDVTKVEFYESDMEYIYNIINEIKDKDIFFTIASNTYLDKNIYDKSSLVKEDIINKFSKLGINEKIYFGEYTWDVASTATIRLDYILKAIDFYNKISEDISSLDLSPYEKFVATHMLVQKYSNYNNGGNNKGFKNSNLSRNPLLLIDEDQIVCAGYTGMESIILNKLGIDSEIILCNKDGYPHTRCISKIEDKKYNVNGNYLSDPTFDSNIYFNLLNNKKNEDVMPYFTSSVFMNLSYDFLEKEEDISYGVAVGLTNKKEATVTSAGNNSLAILSSLADRPIDEEKISDAIYEVTSKIYHEDKDILLMYLKINKNYCDRYIANYLEKYNKKKR